MRTARAADRSAVLSLADLARLESLLIGAGFREVRVERQTREDGFDSIDEYWEPIEAGVGSIPQIYLTLPDAARRACPPGSQGETCGIRIRRAVANER